MEGEADEALWREDGERETSLEKKLQLQTKISPWTPMSWTNEKLHRRVDGWCSCARRVKQTKP